MKIKIVCAAILSVISLGIHASESNTQDDLENLLRELEGKKVVNKATVAEEVNNEDVIVKKANNEHESVVVDSKEILEKDHEKQFDKQEELDSKPLEHDHVYLLNVPIETKVLANKDIYLYPHRDGLIFDDGTIKNASPLKFTDETTYCYLHTEPSGKIRRFKKDTKALTIVDNNSQKVIASSIMNPQKELVIYETTFILDNKHIKAIKCLSSNKGMPLTIGDLNKEMGNILRFEFPTVVDI